MSDSQKKLPSWWVEDTFDVLFRNVTSSALKIQQKNYKHFGKYPVIDQGQDLIGGYTDNEKLLHPNMPPLIVFGDHTRCLKFVDFRFSQGADGVKVLEPNIFMDPKYCFWALKQTSLPDKGYSRHYKFLKNSLLPIPPFNEQKRIVTRIEELQTRSRRAKEALESIPDLLEQLRQSILAAATSGKLTEDWRDNHPNTQSMSELVTQTNTLRMQKIMTENLKEGFNRFRYQPASLIELGNKTKGIDELFDLPNTWEWVSLGQVTWSVADGPHFSPKYVDGRDGIPFISGRNISYKGIDFSDAKHVSHQDHIEFTRRAHPCVGDVLLTKGGTTGIATVVEEKRDFSIWVHVALLKVVDDLISPFYLRDALTAPLAYVQTQAQTHGVGNQDLGLTRMVHIAIPLPPIAEQHEIVKRVEELFKIAGQVEERYSQVKKHLNTIDQSILSKAFHGELVPQDHNDEPAAILLDRVCQEKAREAAQPKAKAIRKAKNHVHAEF